MSLSVDEQIAGCAGLVGCFGILFWLAFWGMVMYGLYYLVFEILPKVV